MWQAVEVLWPATARVRLLQAPPGARYSVAQARTDSKGPQSKTFRSRLCAGYRRRFRRRLAASHPACRLLTAILSGAPSCASVSLQHQQQCISKSVVDCCVASTVAC